jgi:uncharacterized membrane protein
MIRRRWLGIAMVATACLIGTSCAKPLREARGLPVGQPVDINDLDEIVAVRYDRNSVPHTVVLARPGGAMREVRGPGGAGFKPYAVNDHSVIVGTLVTGTGREQRYRAVRWSAEDGFRMLPLPAGTFQSWAADINNSGLIVLNAYSPSVAPSDGAYLWNPAAPGELQRLTEPAGTPNGRPSVAEAINEAGEVAGASGNGSPAGAERAVRWSAGTREPRILGAPGGSSHAYGINERGTIAGAAVTGALGSREHAAAWLGAGALFVDLGEGLAKAVNDTDFIVGQAGSPPRATLWSAATRVSVPLGELRPGAGSHAVALNNRFRAVGDSSGESAEYSLPEF